MLMSPAIRPSLQEIMLRAHDLACEMPDRIPYDDRFRAALCRAWRDAKAVVIRRLRAIVEERVERLIAFLDATDGDCDLEPSLGYYNPHQGYVVDAEEDAADREPSLGSCQPGDQTDCELDDERELEDEGRCEAEDVFYVRRPAIEVLEAEAAATRAATVRLHAILERTRAPRLAGEMRP